MVHRLGGQGSGGRDTAGTPQLWHQALPSFLLLQLLLAQSWWCGEQGESPSSPLLASQMVCSPPRSQREASGTSLQVSSAAESTVVTSKSLPSRDLSVLSCKPGITIPSTAQAGAGWSGDNGVGKSLAYMKNVCFEKDQVFEDYLGLLRVWPLPSV